jgi:hypothetical protein
VDKPHRAGAPEYLPSREESQIEIPSEANLDRLWEAVEALQNWEEMGEKQSSKLELVIRIYKILKI